jgi:hypothetical protein
MSITAADIETAATSPAAASGDAGSVTAVSLPDLIAADKHLAAKAALEGTNDNGGPRSAWHCVRMAKVKMPGAT